MTRDDNVPEHIKPAAIYQKTSDQLDKLIEDIRERRLKPVRQHEAAMQAAKEAADDKARLSLLKQCEMCEGNIIRVDKAIDALETRINKIRALRLELGLD